MLALAATTLVVCAPGYPGNTAEAQPAMDSLARALARATHSPEGSFTAVYEETAAGGVQRLQQKESALLLATLPFYLAHEQELALVARLSAMPQSGETLEKWTLVTAKERPPSLQGYTVQSSSGYSKRFVRAMARKLPGGVEIEQTSAVLSALRRAASGEKVAVLLDGSQAAAMATLPFAGSLAPVETSPPVPVAVIATVRKRIDDQRWKALEPAFLRLAEDRSAREALDGVRMTGFVPLDEHALAAARAVIVGQLCEENVPAAAACDYWLAAALGLQARERSATGRDALPRMVDLLRRAVRNDPDIDHAGPHRLLAIVLLRAPGWPLGPGDPDAALPEAEAAARAAPEFPPNQLALGDALKQKGRAAEARSAYSQALRLAMDAAGRGEPDAAGWADDARAALRGAKP